MLILRKGIAAFTALVIGVSMVGATGLEQLVRSTSAVETEVKTTEVLQTLAKLRPAATQLAGLSSMSDHDADEINGQRGTAGQICVWCIIACIRCGIAGSPTLPPFPSPSCYLNPPSHRPGYCR
jgi:hypothetical protein